MKKLMSWFNHKKEDIEVFAYFLIFLLIILGCCYQG